MPQGTSSPRFQTGASILEYELQEERGYALGVAGRRVETALEALRAFDAASEPGQDRGPVLKEAATAVWYYFIQREACGIRNQKSAIEHYGIPREVLMRLGAV